MTVLTLENASRTYEAVVPVHALKSVSITINQGDFVAIEGPSGAGKSTLLNILALLDKPTHGSYRIDDVDVVGLSDTRAADLRGSIFGFVFQSFHLLPLRTAVENVMLGMAYQGGDPESARMRAYEALAFVGLSERADIPAERLSGGERQRIAIARAICGGAPVVVADEPTGNLDSRSSQLIMDMLADLNDRGTTIIVVTHDPAVAAKASRRLRVVDGVVTQQSDASANDTADGPAAQGGQTTEPGAALFQGTAASPSRHRRRSPFRCTRGGTPTTASRVHPRMLWHDVSQALVSDPGRSSRLIGVVVIAVTLFLTVISLAYTASYQVSDVFDAQRNRRVAVALTDPTDTGYIPQVVAQPDPEAVDRIASINGLQEAMLVSRHDNHPATSDPSLRVVNLPVYGLTPITPLKDLLTTRGETLPLDHDQVLIGEAAASACGLGPLDASPTLWVRGKPYEVVGIITDAGIRSELLGGVVMSQEEASAVAPAAENVLEIRTAPGAASAIANVAALAWVPTHVETAITDSPPDPTQMREELETSVRTALQTLTVVSALSGLAILSNAMNNSVQTRTGELALRRAMGAKRNHLRTLISAESLLIGLIGGACGSILSLLVVLAITIFQHWRPVIDPLSFPLGIVAGILTGLAAAVIASRKAGRIHPAQALR
ncbi:ATP-binding cassette domain-containing protein [Actinomyces sp.]|uniref:macrolide ABC transporter ATP-binding protein/permease n=1 Tax=Actinomyces sp. TaxID=29317 RepID=UPI0026DB6118|nr:ATP-binding cassette domain-containing protein [Actinomyces sp.]MDO4900160.1 ATP-binding cassette domain-containing protein [Actinomyces sp.]